MSNDTPTPPAASGEPVFIADMREEVKMHIELADGDESVARKRLEGSRHITPFQVLDAYDTLTARVREVEGLANRWMQAALYVVPVDTLAFDPMSPEAFAESRRHAIDEIMTERDALRAQLAAATARAAHNGLALQQRVTQTRLHSESVNGNCTSACLASVFGGAIETYDARIPFGPEWWSHVEAIFREHGLLVLQLSPVDGTPAGICFAAGVSPRGVRHLCVAQDGTIIHDPHPSRAGLTEITDYWVAIPWVFPGDSALAPAAEVETNAPMYLRRTLPENGGYVCDDAGIIPPDTVQTMRETDYNHQQAMNAVASLLRSHEALRVQADRYAWLRDRYIGADFDYPKNESETRNVLVIDLPEDGPVWASLDLTVDHRRAPAAEVDGE